MAEFGEKALHCLQKPHRRAQPRRNQRPIPHHHTPAYHCRHWPALRFEAVERRPAAACGLILVADGAARGKVNQRKIGVVTDGDAAFACDGENTLRAGAGEIDEAGERQPAGVDVVEHDRHQRLHAGHAGMRARVGVVLLLARMRRVVGADDVDHPVAQRIYGIAAKGRIALGYDADFTVVDLAAKRKIENSWMASKSGWTPYDGRTVTGWPIATIMSGQLRPIMCSIDVLASLHSCGLA